MKITACSSLCAEILGRGGRVKVHSVYRKTINISAGDRLLSLQASGTVLSPLTLGTDMDEYAMAGLGVAPGDAAELGGGSIRFPSFSIPFAGAEIWDCGMGPEREFSFQFIRSVCAALDMRGGLSDIVLNGEREALSLPSKMALKMITAAEENLQRGQPEQAAQELSRLLGLGEGLTPSGDDFLCGVLASTYMGQSEEKARFRELLGGLIQDGLSRTNTISGGFLGCAAQGYFSRPVLELSRGSLARSVSDFSKIGHSSGADTLSGIIFGLEHIA